MIPRLRYATTLLKELATALQPWDPAAKVGARRRLALEFLDGQAQAVEFKRGDLTWSVFLSDIVGKDLFLTGQYDSRSLDTSLAWLAAEMPEWQQRNWIINVGANIGDTCLQLSQRTSKNFVACEPVPATFRMLRQNIELNELSHRILARQTAIGPYSGHVEMAVTRDSGWSEVRAEQGEEGFTVLEQKKQYVQVPVVTLDELVTAEALSPREVALVWSDTQGFETQVIRSGSTLWSAGVPLWVEFWPTGLNAHGGTQQFIQSASDCFSAFLVAAELNADVKARPRPIEQLAAFAEGVESMTTHDLLLMP